MAKFRKKPVVIEAMQYDGSNWLDIWHWYLDFYNANRTKIAREFFENYDGVQIGTLEGRMTAKAGDWIIRGVAGEFYPCKPDIFAATYEPV
jgi:hypothetical protein